MSLRQLPLRLVLLVQVANERIWSSGMFFHIFSQIKHAHSYLYQFAFVSRRVSFNGFVQTPSSFGIIGARRESACMRQWDVFLLQIKPEIKHVHYLCQFSFVFRQVFFNELVLTFSPPNIIVARRQTACIRQWTLFPTHTPCAWMGHHSYLCQFSTVFPWVFCNGLMPMSSPFVIIASLQVIDCNSKIPQPLAQLPRLAELYCRTVLLTNLTQEQFKKISS